MKTTIKFGLSILMFSIIMSIVIDMTTLQEQNKLPVSVILGMFLGCLSAIEGNTRKDEE